jgi:hypothetical protein
VTKLQSYLAGSVFALLLMANVAMELLNAFPANQYLWHLNLLFAREARPLLQHLDELAGGNSAVTLAALGGLALVSIAAAHMRLRLVAAANCHVALILMLFLGTRSYARSFPYGIPADDIVGIARRQCQPGSTGHRRDHAGAGGGLRTLPNRLSGSRLPARKAAQCWWANAWRLRMEPERRPGPALG